MRANAAAERDTWPPTFCSDVSDLASHSQLEWTGPNGAPGPSGPADWLVPPTPESPAPEPPLAEAAVAPVPDPREVDGVDVAAYVGGGGVGGGGELRSAEPERGLPDEERERTDPRRPEEGAR